MEGAGATVRETVDAAKHRIGAKDVKAVLGDVSKLVVMKGKRVAEYDLAKEPLGPKALAEAVLGPTGNLRAPTIVRGKLALVGFDADTYDARL